MQCSISRLIGLIVGVIVLVGAAMYAGFQGVWGWVGAGVAALGAQGVLLAVDAALTSYKACRDKGGPSECSTLSITNTIAALRVVLGIAITGFFTAAAVFWNIFNGGPAAAAVAAGSAEVACGIALSLLISLLLFVVAYKQCRDRAQVRPSATIFEEVKRAGPSTV